MNVKLTGIILVVTILFFLIVGMDIFINQNRSLRKKFDLQEPPDSVKLQINNEEEKDRKFSLTPRLVMGNSSAEKRYTAALEYLRNREIERNERRYKKQRVRVFMESPAGESLILGLNLLSDGKEEQARLHISEALKMHDNFDFTDYVIMLKGLLHTYFKDADRENIDRAVMSYLRIIKNTYTNASFQKVVGELIDAIQEKMRNE